MKTRILDADGNTVSVLPGAATAADVPVQAEPGWTFETYLEPDDVRAEAQRRIIALTGASSLMETIVKQSNANMRANELNDKRLSGEAPTEAEQAEADALRALAGAIKAIRAASNAIEPLDPIPADYADDSRWP